MDTQPLKHILYVEDDEDIRELVRISLEQTTDYKIDLCASGQEAIDISEKISPQLVILDVMMPNIDGPAVLRHYQTLSKYQKTPFVFMTAKIRDSEIKQYQAMGISGIISKPFDPIQLGQMIEDIWHKFHTELAEKKPAPLDNLNKKYTEKLKMIKQDLLQFAIALSEETFDEKDMEALRFLINNLAGSGESFGYKDISTEATLISKEINDVAITSMDEYSQSRLSALLLALSAIIDQNRAIPE